MVRTPSKVKYTILNSLIMFSLLYDVRSMAVLANPFANMARAIGFNSFGGIAAVLEGARVVLVPELRCANPPPSSILRRMGRSFHQLVDGTHFLLLVLILLHHPSVFNELPCKLVAELLEGGDLIGHAKETVREKCVDLRNGKQKCEHVQFPSCCHDGPINRW